MHIFNKEIIIKGHISKVMMYKTGKKYMTLNRGSITPITCKQEAWQKGKMEY